MKPSSSIRSQIPNCITLCNLMCGVLATYFATTHHYEKAALFILFGILFDFFDGLTARLLKTSSPLGRELDSLADVVTSGVAPGTILFQIIGCSVLPWLRYAALLIPAFAAYRLAKFNLDERQHQSFLGLPAPANAIIWVGIGLYQYLHIIEPYNNKILIIIIILLSILTNILMVSEIPMFSLKFNFKDLSWKTNKIQYIFIIGCILMIVTLQIKCISLTVLWYIILSLLTQHKNTTHE